MNFGPLRLTEDGMIDPKFKYVLPYDTEPIQEREEMEEVVALVKKRMSHSPRKTLGSYEGKHVAERILGRHVSNGEFIWAMLKAGFVNVRFHKGSPNVTFFARWEKA